MQRCTAATEDAAHTPRREMALISASTAHHQSNTATAQQPQLQQPGVAWTTSSPLSTTSPELITHASARFPPQRSSQTPQPKTTEQTQLASPSVIFSGSANTNVCHCQTAPTFLRIYTATFRPVSYNTNKSLKTSAEL